VTKSKPRDPRPYEFNYKGYPVGFFLNDAYPQSDGVYDFEPYRGTGHYMLSTAMSAGDTCECYHDAADVRVTYRVAERLPNNKIRLENFQAFSK
jgi:hypothetical protein